MIGLPRPEIHVDLFFVVVTSHVSGTIDQVKDTEDTVYDAERSCLCRQNDILLAVFMS